jgi:hypothetical protein
MVHDFFRCKNVADYIRISREAKDYFHENGIHSTTIQAEFLDVR